MAKFGRVRIPPNMKNSEGDKTYFQITYKRLPTNLIIFLVAVLPIVFSSRVEGAVVHPLDYDKFNGNESSDSLEFSQTKHIINPRITFEQYTKKRSNFLKDDQSQALGSKIILNSRELLANEVFQVVKKSELDAGFEDPGNFVPAKHIFNVLDDIKNRDMFRLIQKMPKGAVLHAHEGAFTSLDYVISLTYWKDLWCWRRTDIDDITFKFSRQQPKDIDGIQWKLVAEERATKDKIEYDEQLRKYFSLYTEHPDVEYPNNNVVWKNFFNLFTRIMPLITYVPVWKAYYKQALKEYYEDGVQYLEFRSGLPDLYDLDGNVYKNEEVAKVYIEALEEFRAENPDFIGSKLIYAQSRRSDDATFAGYMDILVKLVAQFPKFVVGFDIQSQENTGRPLIDFAEQLLQLPSHINFYFHAGETNWNGMRSDENLIDAVLLGTKRIGHGYAILKHPKVLEAVRNKSIAIELNPISNQVLTLVDQSQNHPGAFLFAEDYPVVVSSDDWSFFETSPLSHDFYIAFMGIASAHADLRMLKRLAMNSLVYSAMDPFERGIAIKKWEKKWNSYIEWVITQRSKYNI